MQVIFCVCFFYLSLLLHSLTITACPWYFLNLRLTLLEDKSLCDALSLLARTYGTPATSDLPGKPENKDAEKPLKSFPIGIWHLGWNWPSTPLWHQQTNIKEYPLEISLLSQYCAPNRIPHKNSHLGEDLHILELQTSQGMGQYSSLDFTCPWDKNVLIYTSKNALHQSPLLHYYKYFYS